MHRAIVLSSLLLAACGGAETPTETPEPAAAAEPAAPEPQGPEAECLAKANPGTELPADAPNRVGVSHLVIKHVDATNVPDEVSRSRGAACLRALEALEKLKGGAEFGEVVAEYSDEAGADTRGGSLGQVKPEDVAPRFAAAAFALDIGQVSYVVESKFGFHVIMRTD
jgi:hypothetical protein